MKQPIWVARQTVDALHTDLLAEHGGAPGLRDEGLLESALARPRQIFAYSNCDLLQLAAAYVTGIVRNHPFVDGNKRVAVTVTAAFLKVNGYRLEFDDLKAYMFLIGLYESGTMRFSELDVWLRAYSSREPK